MRAYLKIAVLFATFLALNAIAAESKKPSIFYNKVGAALTKDKPSIFYNKVGAALSADASSVAPKPKPIVEKPISKQPISVRELPKPQPNNEKAKVAYTYKQTAAPISKVAKPLPIPKPIDIKTEYLDVKAQADEAVSKQEPATAILYDILNDGEAREKIKSKKL